MEGELLNIWKEAALAYLREQSRYSVTSRDGENNENLGQNGHQSGWDSNQLVYLQNMSLECYHKNQTVVEWLQKTMKYLPKQLRFVAVTPKYTSTCYCYRSLVWWN
jgi:hypothetical protein